MLISRSNGATSVIVRAKLRDSSSTTGAGLTGLTSASSGLIISTIADVEATATAYTVAGSTIEAVTTLGTYAAPTATKCRFKEVDSTNHKGVYEFQFADARFAVSGAKSLLISVSGATNLEQTDFVVDLAAAADVRSFGGTAGTFASGRPEVNTTHIAGSAVSTSTAQIGVNVVNFGGSAGTFASGIPAVNSAQIDGVALNGGTGPIRGVGIIDKGTAQAATATTLQLRSAAAFADSELNGATIVITSATAGAGQRRIINSYVGSTDTATVDTWTTTPTGTITYEIYGSPPASTGAPATANVTQWNGTAVASPATAGIPEVNVKNVNNQAASAAAGVTFPSSIASPTNITAGTITTVTNLTNAPTAGDFTATMKTSIGTAVAASAVASVTGNVGGNVTGSVGSLATQAKTDVATAAGAAASYQKNVAASDIAFVLVDSTDHVTRKTGITVTAQRSLDHAAFGSATGTVTEVGNGVYVLSASQADMNANNIVFRFTGTGCDPVELHIKTFT